MFTLGSEKILVTLICSISYCKLFVGVTQCWSVIAFFLITIGYVFVFFFFFGDHKVININI